MWKKQGAILFVLISSLIFFIHAAIAMERLSVADAFQTSITQKNKNFLTVHFNIAEGYDIYKKKIQVTTSKNSTVKLGLPILPKAILEHNEVVGNYEIYKNNIEILVPILNAGNNHLTLELTYQGCKGLEYCFPLVSETKHFILNTNMNPAPFSLSEFLSTTNANVGANIFKYHFLLVLIGFFLVGIFIAFTPCLFPMYPILLTIIAGCHVTTRRAASLAISYSLGGATSYAIAGIFAAKCGKSLQAFLQNEWINGGLVILFILLSLSLFGLFDLQLPRFIRNKLHHHTAKRKSQSLLGVYITGLLAALVLSPCLTAPLAGALLYIATTGNILLGSSALFMMGLGIGVPLLLLAIFENTLLPRNGSWMIVIKQLLGFLMLAVAIYMATRIISLQWIMILSSIWLISIAIFIFRLQSMKSKWFNLTAPLTILLLLLGGMLFIKQVDKLLSLEPVTKITSKIVVEKVNNLQDLNKLLLLSVQQKKPVMLDFTADWCLACKEMEATTFKNPQVINALQHFTVIKIDVTKNDALSQALQKKYDIFAPPSLVFINSKGDVEIKKTVTGYIASEALLPLLIEGS